MIVKIFEVLEGRDGADYVSVQRRRGVRGEWKIMRLAERGDLEEASNASAARHVCLEHVDSAGGEHALKIENVIAVLARSDLHSGGSAVTQKAKAFKIVRGDRLFKPSDIEMGKSLCLSQRLLARVSPVGIDKQFRFSTDGLAGYADALEIAVRVTADLHFHAMNALFHPAGELVCKLTVRVRGEATASVKRRTFTHLPEQRHQRQA